MARWRERRKAEIHKLVQVIKLAAYLVQETYQAANPPEEKCSQEDLYVRVLCVAHPLMFAMRTEAFAYELEAEIWKACGKWKNELTAAPSRWLMKQESWIKQVKEAKASKEKI